MHKPDEEQLNEIIDCIKRADRFFIHNNGKNRATRYRLGLSVVDLENIVRRLTKENWYKGPESNHDISKKEPVWIFKIDFKGIMFYVKLYFVKGTGTIETMSCHIDNIEL